MVATKLRFEVVYAFLHSGWNWLLDYRWRSGVRRRNCVRPGSAQPAGFVHKTVATQTWVTWQTVIFDRPQRRNSRPRPRRSRWLLTISGLCRRGPLAQQGTVLSQRRGFPLGCRRAQRPAFRTRGCWIPDSSRTWPPRWSPWRRTRRWNGKIRSRRSCRWWRRDCYCRRLGRERRWSCLKRPSAWPPPLQSVADSSKDGWQYQPKRFCPLLRSPDRIWSDFWHFQTGLGHPESARGPSWSQNPFRKEYLRRPCHKVKFPNSKLSSLLLCNDEIWSIPEVHKLVFLK